MAGKRLLDAARLFSAGTAIAKQHLGLRRQQWQLLTQTSTLAKAVKYQTDRVTVTAAAAVELAKRFNETGPTWQRQEQTGQQYGHGPGNDAEYERGFDGSENRAHDRSGEFSPNKDEFAASLQRREQQRRAEGQIPSTTADAPNAAHSTPARDTFNERSDILSPGLSSLPRAKIPKHVDTSTTPSSEPTLNQDVFPSPQRAEVDGDDSAGNFEMQDPSVLSGLRVSRMVGKGGFGLGSPYATREKLPPKPLPEMVQAAERWKKEQAESQSPTKSIENTTNTSDAEKERADTEDMISAIAQDAESQSAQPSPVESAPYELRESRVPSSRFGRLWQYGSLATGMAFGAVGEGFRRIAGGSGEGSLMLSEGNMNRLVAKLSRMRGAALKLGQMISFQDSKVLPATINTVLQRVQDSADYMPASQRDKVLIRNLGPNWRELFAEFEEKPFAAASIGQVHKATLQSNGKAVAVKIQYPGVRGSIDSDLNNLSLLLTASQLLPKGLFLDKTIANARTELGWECDYEREAHACIRFKEELLADEPDVFAVPTVYTEASGADVLTAEFMHGKGVTKINDLSQEERNWIGSNILRLCLRELMEWRFMQTDPNWTNFLYNRQEKKIELLDFGASREFPNEFVEPYVALLIAASKGDRDACRDLSVQLGYLTGRESKEMLQAHVDSILTLAEPFTRNAPEVYDFENQTITDRVRANIGLMLRERLAPPPEETYSLHRKLSGAFLLCARLRSKVEAREMFATAMRVWEGRAEKVKI